jgi:hypothetical protein
MLIQCRIRRGKLYLVLRSNADWDRFMKPLRGTGRRDCNPGNMIIESFKMNVTPSTSKPCVSPYLGKELIGILGYSALPCHHASEDDSEPRRFIGEIG